MSLNEIRAIVDHEIEAIRNIPIDESVTSVIDCIHEQVHRKGGKVIVAGVGKAGEIGKNIATTFCSTGTPAVFLHPLEAVHGNLGVLQANDIMIVISNSGRTREVLELCPLAKTLIVGIQIICITGAKDSPIVGLCDYALFTGGPTEICPLGLTPTTSTTVMTVLGDILVFLMMKKIAFSKIEYGKRHHGGYLGILANG